MQEKQQCQKVAISKPGKPSYELPEYWKKEENHAFPADAETIRQFKDLHKGQRCFIVGNGPSLNQTDLTKLKDEISFGVNGIFYKTDEVGYLPTYYVVCDSFVIKENMERINSYSVRHKFFPSIFRKFVHNRDNVSFFLLNRGYNEMTSPNYGIPRFSADCSERIYDGQTVTCIDLQLAYYMGFSEVYLIGVDFSYVIPKSAIVKGCEITSTEDDPNHFHKDYFGKGRSWHDPVLHRVIRNYQFADLVFKWDGRQIFNATKGGKLEAFSRVDYDSLFAPSSGRDKKYYKANYMVQHDTWHETITLTMDGLLIGTGWQPVEQKDGQYFRSLGPEDEATVHISPCRDRGNRLNITVYSSREDGVLDELTLEADEMALMLSVSDGLRGDSKKGFYHLTAMLPKDTSKTFGQPTVLSFRLPKRVPKIKVNPDSKDSRPSSFALQSITVFPLARPLFAAQKYADPVLFDGLRYLRKNPDVRDSVIQDLYASAYEYFLKHDRTGTEDAFELHEHFDECPGDLFDILNADMQEQSRKLEEKYQEEITLLRDIVYRQGDAIRALKGQGNGQK